MTMKHRRRRNLNIINASKTCHYKHHDIAASIQEKVMLDMEAFIDQCEHDMGVVMPRAVPGAFIPSNHIHVCAYKLMRPHDKVWCKARCKEWIANGMNLPGEFKLPEGFDYCDICTKMTLINFSVDDDVMYAQRTPPDLIKKIIQSKVLFGGD